MQLKKTVRSVKKGRHHFGAGKCHFNGIRSIFELEPVIFHGARTVGTWELASLQGSCGVGLGFVLGLALGFFSVGFRVGVCLRSI